MLDRSTSRSDGELVSAAARDPEAIAELYERYEALVAAFLVRQSRDIELSADLTAETFCVALIASRTYRDNGDAAAGWLLGIARNLLLQSWRRGRAETRARQKLGVPIVVAEESLDRVEALIDSIGQSARLRRALMALPETQRDAVSAHILHDRPYPDLATELGIPEATIRQRVCRGLARMRTTLKEDQQ